MDVAVLDPATGAFLAARPRMLDLATRILGSAVEAEDVVQESWMRWQLTDRNNVLNPTAFLATTTTRIAINAVWSAPRRHETYTDPQQLEPHESSARPNVDAERGAAVEEAVLVLLQELAPLERAAYLLREAFGYPYRQIADVLHLEPAHTRQLVFRAHRHLSAGRHRPVNRDIHLRWVRAFLGAARTGNLTELERLLVADVTCHSFSSCPV